jgi:hypothetical protein
MAHCCFGEDFMASWSSWDNSENYCWVVICKNRKFHNPQNFFSGHKIPLGETDAFSPPPAVDFRLTVKCDECGEEDTYEPADVVRFQMELASDFKPHPLFA